MSSAPTSRLERDGEDLPPRAPPGSVHLPSAPLENLRSRAKLLACMRGFFAARAVLEVETPLLCGAGVVDAHLDPLVVNEARGSSESSGGRRYLMTSPELCMKRLLVAGSGPIYQLTRAFRQDESGRLHNPEFTILEWYRPGYDVRAMMDEVEALVRAVCGEVGRAEWPEPFDRTTYRAAFEKVLGIDPLAVPLDRLRSIAGERGLVLPPRALRRDGPPRPDEEERDDWLNLLMATCVGDSLGREGPLFLYDYPASQAALARLNPADARVAERFELYLSGIELANGYHELTDAAEQRRRFEAANELRAAMGKERLPLDGRFLQALEVGLPDCSGVAVGVDRLVLLALGGTSLDEVLAFPVGRV